MKKIKNLAPEIIIAGAVVTPWLGVTILSAIATIALAVLLAILPPK